MRPQIETPPPLVRRILASWWGRLSAILGFLAALVGLADAIGEFSPEIRPESDSSAPTEFIIMNKNPLLGMTDVTLVCNVQGAAFDSAGGVVGFTAPVTSGAVNTEIISRGTAHYPCDASEFMTTEQGKLCLLGLCESVPAPSGIKLHDETISIGVSYKMAGIRMSHESESFTWDGQRWHEGPALR